MGFNYCGGYFPWGWIYLGLNLCGVFDFVGLIYCGGEFMWCLMCAMFDYCWVDCFGLNF